MALTLLDAAASWQLERVGLPTITSLQASRTGSNTPVPDAYLTSASTVQAFSGYGQMFSTLSDYSAALTNSNAALTEKLTTTSDATVATASAGLGAASGASYSVNVIQLAQGTVLRSSYRASDPAAQLLTNGTFNIQLGTNDRHSGVFTPSADAVSVTTTDSSLNGIRTAINNANAGVTAAVASDANGSYLTISSNNTGLSNSISITAAPNSLFASSITSLGLQETQVARNASVTVNGTAVTGETNALTIATDTVLNVKKVGSTTLTIGSTLGQSVTSPTGASSAAQNLTNSFNTLMLQLNALNGGQLAGNANLATIASELTTASTKIYANAASSLTKLSDIGITSAASGIGNTLTFNSTTFASAFTSDSVGVVKLLSNATTEFQSKISGYLDPAGTILSGLRTTVFSGSDAAKVAATPLWVKNAVLAYELNGYS